MANPSSAVDLHQSAATFEAANAELYALKVNRLARWLPIDSRARAVAQWANLVDDFMLEAQTLLRLQRNGSGSPEGAIAAEVGTLYLNTEASPTGSRLWVKATGTGTTGWSQVGGLEAGDVTLDLLADAPAVSVLARAGNTSGVRADLASGGARRALISDATNAAIAFRALVAADIPLLDYVPTTALSGFGATLIDDANAAAARGTLVAAGSGDVTASGLTMNTARILARTSASSGALEERAVLSPLTLGAGGLGIDVSAIDVDGSVARWVQRRAIDLSLWASTDFAAGGDGTYALDDGGGSLTWTAGSTANANSAGGTVANCGFFRRDASDTGSDSASGLRIAHDPSVSTTLSASTQTGPRLTIPLSSLIPNYNPFSEYRIEIEVTRLTERGSSPSATGIILAIYAPGGTPTGSANRYGGVRMQRNGAGEGAPTIGADNATVLPITAATHAYTAPNHIIGVRLSPEGVTTAYCSTQYSSGWPADTAYRALGITSPNITDNAASAMNASETLVEIGVDTRSSSAGCTDFMVRRLRVLERVR